MPRRYITKAVCTFPGCNGKHRARGLCAAHCYQLRVHKQLKPLRPRRPHGSPPQIKYDETSCPCSNLEGPCHIFRGRVTHKGYGQVRLGKKKVSVHRYVWERDVGTIPAGMEIDHQCKMRACCNVKHLRVVTKKQNTLENSESPSAKNAIKTHCIRGHPFDAANIKITPSGRNCRACKIEYDRQRYLERKKKHASRV